MKDLQLTFTFLDGRVESYIITPGDRIRYQRQFRESILNLFPPDQSEGLPDGWEPPEEKITYLGWCAARRLKLTELDFEGWLDELANYGGEVAPLATRNGESPALPPLPESQSTP